MPKLARTKGRRKSIVPGKLYPLNMRTTGDIRSRLEQAAAASGRSLANEVGYRLGQSFERDQWLDLLFRNRELAAFLERLADLAWKLEQKAGKSSQHDLAIARAIQALWIRAIYGNHVGAVPSPNATLPALLKQIGPLGVDYDFDRGAIDRLNERIPEMARLVQEVETEEAASLERRAKTIESALGRKS